MRCQTIGFFAMFIFYIVIYGAWSKMGGSGATVDGAKAMQVLYCLSSFFNQFGPNSTTCLVAGLDLEEYDRMQRCILKGRFKDYHGEALNPKHLSLWEIYVQRWHLQYNPELDREMFEAEIKEFALTDTMGQDQLKRSSLVTPEVLQLVERASQVGVG
ncbi:hypothetical protein CEUSTIGMA_g3623.t1 [Chlamydomonas eustigma]|uniref:Uncharacterized protein n=1 Tax=Chlamydomonas eustigma TaxID=1157962 RepID=A0A250WZQ8_9CHLO|nr:hypothetical protein CEUSTIGMA_g3623.t1 [Chlamydomonas eustigma]|eukprot:GAX76179.1 hypothetical protein CEUSTIGMA_g3623.t1 [Chlamydomonas eustigma]